MSKKSSIFAVEFEKQLFPPLIYLPNIAKSDWRDTIERESDRGKCEGNAYQMPSKCHPNAIKCHQINNQYGKSHIKQKVQRLHGRHAAE